MRSELSAVAAVAPLLACASAVAQSCTPEWSQELGGGRPTGWVRALAVWDDGTGPGLFIGTRNGTGTLSKWDGSRLTYHGTFHDEGDDGGLSVLFPFDDGSGPALWGGGSFTDVDGVPAANIARWDGEAWTAVGLGMDRAVRAMEVFDDGSGPKLHAGGYFTRAGAAQSPCVASWDGTQWRPLGTGLSGNAATPTGYLGATAALVMRTFAGKGPRSLYVGGMFSSAGGTTCNGIARWDGTAWSPLGSGLQFSTFSGAAVALQPFDDGTGPSLFVGGTFMAASGVPAYGLARWDGQAWYVVPGAAHQFYSALATADFGQGTRLFGAGSVFPPMGVGMLTPGGWTNLPGFTAPDIQAMVAFDDSHGPRLYAASQALGTLGGSGLTTIARWDGAAWEQIPCAGASAGVSRLKTLDDGTGAALYAVTLGGTIGGVGSLPIARFDGTTWQMVGDGSVNADDLVVFDDGAGPKLYVNGGAAGSALKVSRLVGRDWVGVPGSRAPLIPHAPERMAVFADSDGSRLYIAGQYEGMVRAWDGQQWTIPGGGVPGSFVSTNTYDMLVYRGSLYLATDLGVVVYGHGEWGRWSAPSLGRAVALASDSNGPDSTLYAVFDPVGGPAGAVTRYDPSFGTWVYVGPPGSGLTGAAAIRWFDDGAARPALYAGGRFRLFGGEGDTLLARWDGLSWSPMARSEVDGGVSTLAATNFGRPTLWAGGGFSVVNGVSSSNIAAYEGCAPCSGDCNRDGALNLADFACFQNLFALGQASADCNGDGVRNLADFGCFQTKFALGCP